jgi:integrase/recombinase XerD
LGSHAAASTQTQRSYVREARRLLAWLIWTKGADDQLLPLMTLPEATAFVHWLERPGSSLVPAEVLTRAGLPGTQPVKAGLGRSSLSQAVVILYGLYDFLNSLQAPWGPYAPKNPFRSLKAPIRKGIALRADGSPEDKNFETPTSTGGSSDIKALSPEHWREVLAEVELLPRKTPRDVQVYWQTWWMMRLQYHSVFRRFESVKAQMSDIRRTGGFYELHVVGKGRKQAAILMGEVFVRDFTTYRLALGLPALPVLDESGPLIVHIDPVMRAKGAHISEATLYRRVTGIFRRTADRLVEQGAKAEDVAPLREATLDGVRHTGITHLLDAGVSMRTTSKLARHASVATTANYELGDKLLQLRQINDGAIKLDRRWGLSDSASTTESPLHGASDLPAPS